MESANHRGNRSPRADDLGWARPELLYLARAIAEAQFDRVRHAVLSRRAEDLARESEFGIATIRRAELREENGGGPEHPHGLLSGHWIAARP